MACDQCEALSINGVACHETGCPNSWKDPATGEPYTVKCKFCGCDFTPEDKDQYLCSDDCANSYVFG